jgi:hypothetical protein
MLTNRPLVVSDQSTLEVRLQAARDRQVHITFDGQTGFPLLNDDRVTITRSPRSLRLVKAPTAVVVGDDHVLGDVHQPAGRVAAVGRLQRGVRQALARPVSRDEVLQHGEALAEVRRARRRRA